MDQAKPGRTIKVHYTGKLEDGTVFDSSTSREPLEFRLGEGRVIPGFEEAVSGMSPGETKTALVPADQAYGPHRREMVVSIDRKNIPADLQPQVGQRLQLRQSDGQVISAAVTDVSDSRITLDANHPLAGRDLIFDLEVVEVT